MCGRQGKKVDYDEHANGWLCVRGPCRVTVEEAWVVSQRLLNRRSLEEVMEDIESAVAKLIWQEKP
jgi:hypothetical protein